MWSSRRRAGRAAALAPVLFIAVTACQYDTLPPPMPIDAALVVAACVSQTACLPGSTTMSRCIATYAELGDPHRAAQHEVSPAQVKCLAEAGNNCTKVAGCLNGGMAQTSCTADACEGAVAVRCERLGIAGELLTQRFDCASVALNCVMRPVPNPGMNQARRAECATGPCTGAPDACTGTGGDVCSAGDIADHLDCAWQGASCGKSGGGDRLACIGTGGSCGAPDETVLHCEGSVAVRCLGGKEAPLECARFGKGCFQVPGAPGTFRCALGSECTESYTPLCAGTKLSFCADGKITKIDCNKYGFRGCTDVGSGRCTL